ncbi:ABC transporter ATP-binding protein/permease [Ruminococcaceae bacterium OttesenSCG-928-L11]|nr:ABC transporter ATP-binding protein/permease [Ruminococcaceae bacterium OttesenSCG-928-L11]
MMNYEDEVYNKPFSWKVWAKMLPFFKPYKKQMVIVTALMLVCATVDVLLPLLQKYVIDNFIVPQTTEGVVPMAIVAAIVSITATVATIVFTRTAMRVEMGFSRDLKKALFDHLQTLSLSYYNTTPVGYMIARVMSDTGRIGGLVAWGLVDVMWGLAYVVFVIITMLVMEWRLGILIIIMIPFMALVTSWFQNRILKYNRKVRQTNSRITGSFNEGINGARTSKTLVIEDINYGEFRDLTGEMYGASVRASTLGAIYMPVILFFGIIAVALILVNGSGYVISGAMKFGTLSAMISYAIGIFEPVQNLARTFADVIATQANIERVTGLLEQEPMITDTPQVIAKYGDSFDPKRENWEPLEGHITFDDVTFMYPDGTENVLEHFKLDVPAGTTVAIVGETGAGKSTLVNLVCRFFEPTGGRVLIDGRDYKERSQLWLHSNIGYVLQSPHLFSGSIRENIRYGRLDATDEEIMEAARLVSADKIIEKLPKGLDSDVGEGGDRLSTGEKQLISFARAVLADPRIFVLDEATSSIDTQTEALIQNAISNILQGRTSFLIAHRLSTIKMADLILVVRGGKIVEQGTHRELLQKGGYYRQLYTMQFESEMRIGEEM